MYRIPRAVSTVISPQTLVPERAFALSPSHVSLPASPGRGTEWNSHNSFPVCTSHPRVSPDAPTLGNSCTRAPVIKTFLYTIGGEESPNTESGNPFDAPAFISTTPSFPNPGTGFPVFAFSATKRPSAVPKNTSAGD